MINRFRGRMRRYLRDGRSPIPRFERTSKVMSANRGKDTGPEMALRRALRAHGLTGYRLDWRQAPGRPDIAFPGRKVAIFVHGCFWHRCPRCAMPLPRSNRDFWRVKFKRNVARDKKRCDQLGAMGWKVIVVWECEIEEDIKGVLVRISRTLDG